MSDVTPDEVPTYFANIVTSNVNVDDLVMEFRRVDKPHAGVISTDPSIQPLTMIPAPTPAEILERRPVARIVLTFSAAKALKEYLDVALPRAEEARRRGAGLS